MNAMRRLVWLLFFSCAVSVVNCGLLMAVAHSGSPEPEGDKQVAYTIFGSTKYVTDLVARWAPIGNRILILAAPGAVVAGLVLGASRPRKR